MSSYGTCKIIGASVLVVGLVGTILFLASTIISFVFLNSDYYYANDPAAVKYKLVNCCQITSMTGCEISTKGARFCKVVVVKYPSNLKNIIDLVQNSNSAYYGLKTDLEKFEKREQINAPFYFNPKNDTIDYYTANYPRDLWLDFNCEALVKYVANGTNSELTSSFTSSNYPNFASFNSSLTLTMTEKNRDIVHRRDRAQQVSKQDQVGDFETCFMNSNGDLVYGIRYSDLYLNLSGWGYASITFMILFVIVTMTGIIMLVVYCRK